MNARELGSRVAAWLGELGAGQAIGGAIQCNVRPIAVGPGSEMSVVYAIHDVARHFPDLILRRIVNDDWLRREGDLATREATALRIAQRLKIPTPRLVAFDSTGRRTGRPAVLMTRVAGEPPATRQRFSGNALDALARHLREIHEVDPAEELEALPPYRPHHWRTAATSVPPAWASARHAWERAAEIAASWDPLARSARRRGLVHRDFRPANTLWTGGSLVGVLDWITACHGDPAADVGHCRWNLWREHGAGAAEKFSRSYGIRDYDPIWDILAAIGGHPDTPPVDSKEAARLDTFVEAAVAAC